jgi:hypothetical protein
MDVWGDSLKLFMWKEGPSISPLIGTISLSEADEGLIDGWIQDLQHQELVECHRSEDPFHREDVNSSCLMHLIYPSTNGIAQWDILQNDLAIERCEPTAQSLAACAAATR